MNLNNSDIKIIVYTLGGIAIVGGGTYFGRRWWMNYKANKEELKSIDEGNPSTYAKQIKMAFENDGWWGTNTTLLRRTIIEIPTRDMMDRVIDSYKKLYGRNLLKDLSDELQSTEYNEMISIISSKPLKQGATSTEQYSHWAKRLKAAFDKEYGMFPGTDEEAIQAVFIEIPTKADYKQVADTYLKLYGNTLDKDLRSELEFWEIDEYMAIINSKP